MKAEWVLIYLIPELSTEVQAEKAHSSDIKKKLAFSTLKFWPMYHSLQWRNDLQEP